MFDNFIKDKQIVDKYVEDCHIDKTDMYFSRHKLSARSNPKEFFEDFFKNIKSGSVTAITEIIVYDEDAYLNAAAAQADDKHRRFYTVNEILDMTKEYAKLDYFINFKEEVLFDNMLKHLPDNAKRQEILKIFNDFPDNIKKLLSFKEENSSLISFAPNEAVFIMTKK